MAHYRDYLEVSENFIPVFTEEVDRAQGDSWQAFIPQKSMRDILEKLHASLDRGGRRTGDIRSLWIQGAYGTGKTHAAFVLKHVLEDDMDVVGRYFQRHKEVIGDLWGRFQGLRSGEKQFLTVYRSGSGDISSDRKFRMEFQQAIKRRLREVGLQDAQGESITELVLNKITADEGWATWWEAKFRKYRGRFDAEPNAQAVVTKLQAGHIDTAVRVAEVLEEEGIIINDNPTALKEWVRAVIEKNNLQGIVFIWDEFTEFFTQNIPVTTLQELAHSTTSMPFYFVLVTHKLLEQFTRLDQDTQNKLKERFFPQRLDISPVTAYRLIGNAIVSKSDKAETWETEKNTLWDEVDRAYNHIRVLTEGSDEILRKEEFKNLVPIHPVSAFLLAQISKLFSSSQRTLFQFLKSPEDTDDQGSFQWFIQEVPSEEWRWLTPDYLWDYFFSHMRLERVEHLNDIISHYQARSADIKDPDELRVFKVMVLLAALWRQTAGGDRRLKPSLEGLKRAFVGTSLAMTVKEVAEAICNNKIMQSITSDNDVEYIPPAVTLDEAKLRQAREQIKNTYTFEKVINLEKTEGIFSKGLKDALNLQGSAVKRHPVQVLSAKELSNAGERLVNTSENVFELPVVLVPAQDEGVLNGAEQSADEISKNLKDTIFVISQAPFFERRWNDWVEFRARYKYHTDLKDGEQARFFELRAQDLFTDWLEEVRRGKLVVFFRGQRMDVTGISGIVGVLSSKVSEVFCYGPETLNRVNTFYTNPFNRNGAEIGLGVEPATRNPEKDFVAELQRQNVWGHSALRSRPDHVLTRLVELVDGIFANNENVKLIEVWGELQKPPFGLMPSPIGIILFGFAMRSYANNYYWSDGRTTQSLNPHKLAELIEQVVRPGNSNVSELVLRRVSAEGEEFCQLSREIFHFSEAKTPNPDETRKTLRVFLSGMGYPLWSIKYVADSTDVNPEEVANAIDNLVAIIDPNLDSIDEDIIKAAVYSLRPVRSVLRSLISKERMQTGLTTFWQKEAPLLQNLMQELSIDIGVIIQKLRALLSEDAWIWTEEKVSKRLPRLVKELDLTDALNKLCSEKRKELSEITHVFRTRCFTSKFPLFLYSEGQSQSIKELISELCRVSFSSDSIETMDASFPEEIRVYRGTLISIFQEPEGLLKRMLERHGHLLDASEVSDLYRDLPDLSAADTTEEAVWRAVEQAVINRAKQLEIQAFIQKWRNISGVSSVNEWSKSKGVPIQWVLDGEEFQTFLKRATNPGILPQSEVKSLSAFLESHSEKLMVINDTEYVMRQFLLAVGPSYFELIQRSGLLADLHKHILHNYGDSLIDWPMRLNEIQRATNEWVKRQYQEQTYQVVVDAVEKISHDDIRRIIRKMAKDPVVGSQLLSMIGKEGAAGKDD